MKKSILTFAFFVLIASSFAQAPFTFGVKGSINSSKITTDNYASTLHTEITYDNFKSDAKAGYNLGVFARLGNKTYLQPELLYCVKKGETNSGELTQNLDLYTIQVPVLLGIKVFDLKLASVRAFTGPAMSFVLDNSEINYKGITDQLNYTENFKNNTWDWQLGAGVDVGQLVFDVRYSWGLSNVSEGDPDKISFVNKGNTLTFSIGFKLM